MQSNRSLFIPADGLYRCADPDAYRTLLDAARTALAAAKHARHTQCIALLTSRGRLYTEVIADALSDAHSDEARLLDRLSADGDTTAAKLVCMWHEGSVDAPSWAFRSMLTALDPANAETEMLLIGKNGYLTYRIREFK